MQNNQDQKTYHVLLFGVSTTIVFDGFIKADNMDQAIEAARSKAAIPATSAQAQLIGNPIKIKRALAVSEVI